MLGTLAPRFDDECRKYRAYCRKMERVFKHDVTCVVNKKAWIEASN